MSPALYVEDDADDAFFLRHVWKRAGIRHPLIHLSSGQQAMDYLAGRGDFADRVRCPPPSLVLLDLNMPGIGGFDVLRWIRQQPDLAALRVVVFSGSNQPSDLATAQGLGAIDYLTKPSDLQRLLEVVQQKKGLWLPAEMDERPTT